MYHPFELSQQAAAHTWEGMGSGLVGNRLPSQRQKESGKNWEEKMLQANTGHPLPLGEALLLHIGLL